MKKVLYSLILLLVASGRFADLARVFEQLGGQPSGRSTQRSAQGGVPPPPEKPTITPAFASSRIAAWVMEVPVPNKSTVELAMGMFQ